MLLTSIEALSTQDTLSMSLTHSPFEIMNGFCGSVKLSEQMTEKLNLIA